MTLCMKDLSNEGGRSSAKLIICVTSFYLFIQESQPSFMYSQRLNTELVPISDRSLQFHSLSRNSAEYGTSEIGTLYKWN